MKNYLIGETFLQINFSYIFGFLHILGMAVHTSNWKKAFDTQ